MQSISVLFDIIENADSRRKNADVRRVQWLWYVIYMFYGFSLGKI